LHLLWRIDLRIVQRGLEVVQLVRVGLLAENARAVVIGERLGDRLDVVLEIEDEDIVFLRVGAIEAR
jgi:hypothetical protein